jgi:hypothetical protein
MNYPNKFSHLLLVLVFCLLHCSSSAAARENGPPAESTHPVIRHTETAVVPVIEFNLVHHMLAEPDPEPLLRIYGNGRAHVHYPAYMTRAGDYELRLSQAELQTLLRALATDGIIDFDPVATGYQRQQFEAQQRETTGSTLYISDSSDTVIVVRLDEYQRGPGTARIRNLEKRFKWPDLEQDARRFPRLREITSASKAAQRLDSLLQRADLVKIR